jgi:hypothetical protein
MPPSDLPDDLFDPQSRSRITYSKLLVLEGFSACQFFKALLRQLNLLEEIEIRNFGGINDLSKYLKTLRGIAGFSGVTSLGIVRDAEKDASSAFKSICRSLSVRNLPAPSQPGTPADGRPRVSVFILPDCESPGMLETLCLRAVAEDPAITCVEEYLACLQRKGVPTTGNVTKARLHTFLASRKEPDLLLGQAAHEGYWLWDNPAFDQLKEFLRTL